MFPPDSPLLNEEDIPSPRTNSPDTPDYKNPEEINGDNENSQSTPPAPDTLDDDTANKLAPGFREAPAIRLLYLQTVISSIFGSRTVLDCNHQLTDGLDLIQLASSLAGSPPLYPIKPAQTLATAKHRLGLEVDDYIEKRPICTVCFKYYSNIIYS